MPLKPTRFPNGIDVGAGIVQDGEPIPGGVTSVNGETGAVILTADDVGALATDGNAASAAHLATARTISLTGSVAATGTFDGSANLSLATTVSAPTADARGGVLQQAAIANLTAAPTMADINGILAALRSAGVLAST